MIDINDYKLEFQRRTAKLSRIWLLLLIFIVIGFIIINSLFKYYDCLIVQSEYQDKYLNSYILTSDIDKIIKNNRLIIEEKTFAYRVSDISKDNYFINNNYYKLVKLEINNKNIKENQVIKIKIILNKTSITNYLYKLIWR